MPSSSAPVDPKATGHPVALTRGETDVSVQGGAETGTSGAARVVSFATDSGAADASNVESEKGGSAAGLFSEPDFARAGEGRAEEVVSPSEAAPAGGLKDGE